ncbi:MAG: hypothetical protein ACOXZ6_04110 [Syntrophomonadaceae bacterium]
MEKDLRDLQDFSLLLRVTGRIYRIMNHPQIPRQMASIKNQAMLALT